jgi:pimeloyl-[acyl-carrier protein] methyl ester esterase
MRSPHAWLGVFRGSLKLLPARQPPAFIRNFLLLGPDATPALRAMHAGGLADASPRSMLNRLDAIATVDVRAEARALAVPSIYLRATGDRLVGRDAADDFVRHASSGRLVELPGPHLLLQVNPRGAAEAIRAFVKTLTPRAAHG